MRPVRTAGQALRLAAESSNQPYVCRACLARSARQFSSSAPSKDDRREPFWKRMQDSLFGTKEAAKAQESRDLKTKQRLEEVAKKDSNEPETRTDKHGHVFHVAEIVDPSTHDNYVQATTWQGLERVGSEQWVRQRADQGEQYSGFMPQRPSTLSNEQWRRLLHHIIAEVATLQKAGRDVLSVCDKGTPNADVFDKSAKATVETFEGRLTVRYEKEGDERAVLAAGIEELDEVRLRGRLHRLLGTAAPGTPTSYQQAAEKISLQDPKIKLAVIKRAMQLTGKRVSDAALSEASTLQDLYEALRTRETPKKLAQTEELQRLGEEIPNVQVHYKRQTPVHKEKAIGRWKVIEDELALRDLPVFGTRFQDSKERLKNNGL